MRVLYHNHGSEAAPRFVRLQQIMDEGYLARLEAPLGATVLRCPEAGCEGVVAVTEGVVAVTEGAEPVVGVA